jgi:hypothetical protein
VCGEVVEEREVNESDALSKGCEDEDVEDREANVSDALSTGREDDEGREVRESAALSEGFDFEDGRKDEEERDVSESATLNEGRGTRDDFLRAVEESCEGSGASVDFSCI